VDEPTAVFLLIGVATANTGVRGVIGLVEENGVWGAIDFADIARSLHRCRFRCVGERDARSESVESKMTTLAGIAIGA